MVESLLKSHNRTLAIKFFCSYAGRILPRYSDGRLRYHGGVTRVLSVNYSVSFAELLVKMEELCGSPVSLIRCKFPTEDLDALVSITSDEDLVNLIEEYGYAAPTAADPPKIRAFLSIPKTIKKPSPPSSSASSCSSDGSPPKSPPFHYCAGLPPRYPGRQFIRKAASIPVARYSFPVVVGKAAGEIPKRYLYQYHKGGRHGYGGEVFIVHYGYS